MGFVFVSHASIDKLKHVGPIVLALAREGVSLWVDKPGQGDGHLGLDHTVVERLGIRGLIGGPDWNRQISDALKESDAVLVCLSKQLLNDRAVLNQEVAIAWHYGKLVACRVDDLDLEQIPDSLGLPDFRRMQSLPIDTTTLQLSIDWLDRNPGRTPEQLPSEMRMSWEAIRKLRLDLETIRRDQTASTNIVPAAREPELDIVEYAITQAAGGSAPAIVGCLLKNYELGAVKLKSVRITTRAIWDLPMALWTDQFETQVPQNPPRAHIPARVGAMVNATLDVVVNQSAREGFGLAIYSRHAKNERLNDWDFGTPTGSMLFLLDLELMTDCGSMALPSVVADLCGYKGTGTAYALRLSQEAEHAIAQRIAELRAALAAGATIDPDLLAGLDQYQSSLRPRRD